MTAIDILLPYWGDVGYFKAAVSSVVAQSSPAWRMTILEDHYPSDEPAAWVAALSDPRIAYLRNEQNLGANANYRKALGFASAPLVVVMGADDVMLPGFVESVLATSDRHPDAAVIQPGVRVIGSDGAPSLPLADRVKRWYAPGFSSGAAGGEREAVLAGEEMAVSLLRADWAYFPSLAWRTETITRIGFRHGLDVVQDLALLLDIAAEGGSLVATEEVVFHYRRHSGSDSSLKAVNGARFEEERAFFAGEAQRFAALGWERAARAARWHVSSRLNAGAQLFAAARLRDGAAARALMRHIVG